MSDEIIQSIDIQTDLTSFVTWLIELVRRDYSDVFELSGLYPTATPWALQRDGIDPWDFRDKYTYLFSRHSLATSWMLNDPWKVSFEFAQLSEDGIHIEISSPESDDFYLNKLIDEILEHWQDELVEKRQPTFEEKSMMALKRLYEEVGADMATAVDIRILVADDNTSQEELFNIAYWLISQGFCKRSSAKDKRIMIRFTPAGIEQVQPGSLTQSELELHVDDIDSFSGVKDVGSGDVKDLLPLVISEDQIQTYFEEIIEENYHQKDWGGEINDLFTSRLIINGQRVRTAFLLKGSGTTGKLTISKCGKNGDQIVRLVESPSELFIIQHVNEIDQRVIRDLRSKIELENQKGHSCRMCIIDGTDTARILKAYGKL